MVITTWTEICRREDGHYLTLSMMLIENACRHLRRGSHYVQTGNLEYACGSYRKAYRNFERARALMAIAAH